MATLASEARSSYGDACFDYSDCVFGFGVCNTTTWPGPDPQQSDGVHTTYRYNDVSAAWVLICAIIVFFMKAGFMLVELSFAQNIREKRHVVVVKHLDVFASAFGFFFIGFDLISHYSSPENIPVRFFDLTDPLLWFFKFTFASNAATIVGGCLVTHKYKMRLSAAFISAFVISGVLHPIVARIIWTDHAGSLSPYRFCNGVDSAQGYYCTEEPFHRRIYTLDFAGGGAVHLVGGLAGLVLCLFAKLQKKCDASKCKGDREGLQERPFTSRRPSRVTIEEQEEHIPNNFLEWMYPIHGGGETTSEAALGVLILWFSWFAFNCGSTESVQSSSGAPIPYHGIPSFIAANMIMAAASGGVLAVCIAVWAQIRLQTESVNANEIANGVLSALVAITAGCPFVDFWGAFLIGIIAVLVYHFGCWLEYKFGIEDTARVVPVHGFCGLWSMLAIGIFVQGENAHCLLHATFEGLCYCELRLPLLGGWERLLAQLLRVAVITGITLVGCTIMYGTLFMIPVKIRSNCSGGCWNPCIERISVVIFKQKALKFEGNWLLTGPKEIPKLEYSTLPMPTVNYHSEDEADSMTVAPQVNYGSTSETQRETLGTVESHAYSTSTIGSTRQCTTQTGPFSNASQPFLTIPEHPHGRGGGGGGE